MTEVDSDRSLNDELPEGWARSGLSNLLEVQYGKSLPERSRRPGKIPVYGSNGVVGFHQAALTKGPTIVIGRKGSVGAVHKSDGPCWPIDTTYFVDDFGPLDPLFVMHVLRSLDLPRLDTSTAVPGISRDDINRQDLAIPPVAEQRRIVATAEKLVARVEAARQHLEKVPAIINRFREAVLSAACQGRLTGDWRRAQSNEPHHLTERIREARNHRGLRTPANPTSDFELAVPLEWPIVSADLLMSRITSGSRGWKRYYSTNGWATFVMAQNIRPLHFDRTFGQGVNPPRQDPETVRTRIEREDLLVTIVGANTGDACRVPARVDNHFVCQSVALLRPLDSSISPYLELWFNSPDHGRLQYLTWAYGEGRPHLSFDHLRQMAVALPPIEEQREIVRRVRGLLAIASAIECRTRTADALTGRVMEAILGKAFRGQLVLTEAELARQEGRNYEPAAALIKRFLTSSDPAPVPPLPST